MNRGWDNIEINKDGVCHMSELAYLLLNMSCCHVGMDQYLLIPFLVGYSHPFTSYFDVNYRGTIGFDTLLCTFPGRPFSLRRFPTSGTVLCRRGSWEAWWAWMAMEKSSADFGQRVGFWWIMTMALTKPGKCSSTGPQIFFRNQKLVVWFTITSFDYNIVLLESLVLNHLSPTQCLLDRSCSVQHCRGRLYRGLSLGVAVKLLGDNQDIYGIYIYMYI